MKKTLIIVLMPLIPFVLFAQAGGDPFFSYFIAVVIAIAFLVGVFLHLEASFCDTGKFITSFKIKKPKSVNSGKRIICFKLKLN